MTQSGDEESEIPAAGAPPARGLAKAVADDHIIVGVQAVGDLVKDSRVLVVGNQAVADDGVLVADIEPEAVPAIVDELALLDDHIPAEHQLVASPASQPRSNPLTLLLRTTHSLKCMSCGARGAEADLTVVPKHAAADEQVPGRERRPTRVRRLESTVLDHAVVAHELCRAVLGHVRRVAKPQAPQMDVLTLDVPQNLTCGRFNARRLIHGEVRSIARANVDPLPLQIDVERAPAQRGLLEDLKQRVAENEDLLATADHPVLVVARMRARLAPPDEPVRPGCAEDVLCSRLLTPLPDQVGPGDHDVFAGRGLEANRALLRAALFDRDGLAVNPRVNHHRVARPGLRDGLRNRAELRVRRQAGQVFRCDMPGIERPRRTHKSW